MNYTTRISALKSLRKGIIKKQKELVEALRLDFGKSEQEVILTEIYPALNEIDYYLKNLKDLMKAKKVSTPLTMMGSSSYIEYIPKGKLLIISPWNYPFLLAVDPVIAAVAAGNTFDLAPSELTKNCSQLLSELIEECLSDWGEVHLGGKETVQSLLLKKYDHIFFTGSTRVGQIIMESAAKQLCPVTLELGGKSPVLVDETASLKEAAQKIMWAKRMNGGQTCVAPDYILVSEKAEASLLEELKKQAQEFEENYPTTQIINEGHYRRLKDMILSDENDGVNIVYQGKDSPSERVLGLRIYSEVDYSKKCMSEEIFGPILPVIKVKDMAEATRYVKAGESPLASYLFSNDKNTQMKFSAEMKAGGSCINHLILHLANHHLPFGGVGASGMGAYHGKWGFKEFSHKKAVVKAGPIDPMKLFYKLNNKERFQQVIRFLIG